MRQDVKPTPIKNKLPSPVVHNENIYLINSTDKITKALEEILTDNILRKKLENSSRKYYEQFASPSKVIESTGRFAKPKTVGSGCNSG